MKRYGNLFDKICSLENLRIADRKARKNKKNKQEIAEFDKNKEENLLKLQRSLLDGTYKTSKYHVFKIYEPKEREIFKLPYYPDRIVHHAIMNVLEPIWVNQFNPHTYSCIKERGIHKAHKDIYRDLKKDPKGTKYCFKADIRKFYPSIDHNILKTIIRIKIKDKRLLSLLDDIIDSANGVPIGNYLSQYFANLYLARFDYWIVCNLKMKYYYRYADDIVILCSEKKILHIIRILIQDYLHERLHLKLKTNYQIFPVESRGIDFVGYKFYHSYILLRKGIKNKMWRKINRYKNSEINRDTIKKSMQSYFGWMKYCDSKHLLTTIELVTGLHFSNWFGINRKISTFAHKTIYLVEVVHYSKYFELHFKYKGESITAKSISKKLLSVLFNCKCLIIK